MKIYRGSGGTVRLILNLVVRCSVNTALRPLYSRYTFSKRLGIYQSAVQKFPKNRKKYFAHHHHHHHHISFMELGHLLTRSGLTYPKVYHDSFCQLDSSISLPWATYFEAFIYMLYPACLLFQQFVQNWCYF